MVQNPETLNSFTLEKGDILVCELYFNKAFT